MFNWATSKLTSLSETLAPPPSTPTHRFLSALSQSNENLALSILNDPHEPLDLYAALNTRGMSSIHVAASHGALNVVREIMNRGVRVDITDYNGWSALHHASASTMNSSLPLVKFLVEECNASILLKNNEGGTAYDVASSQSVRGYLLPRQLQLETKEALDNGGKGLMPGIDLGGCQVNYSNLAPPPVIGPPGNGVPPPSGAVGMNNNNYDPMGALMQPPPVRGIGMSPRQPVQSEGMTMMSPSPMQSNVSSVSSYSTELANNANNNGQDVQQQWQPPPSTASEVSMTPSTQPFHPPPVANGPSMTSPIPLKSQEQQLQQQQPQQQQQPPAQNAQPGPTQQNPPNTHQPPKSNTSQPPPRSNSSQSSGSYALRGGNANAASVLGESTTGRRIYRPDGFHSSSNDRELQAKYGHVENEFEASRKAAVPPPPKSGGAPISGGGAVNPYSGYTAGAGRSRYPAYCAVSNSVTAPPNVSTGGYPYNAGTVPSYANFSQGGFGQQNVHQQPQQWGVGQQPVQQQQWGGDVNQNQSTQSDVYGQQTTQQQQQWGGNGQHNQSNLYGQQPIQQQQWESNVQQNQLTQAQQPFQQQQHLGSSVQHSPSTQDYPQQTPENPQNIIINSTLNSQPFSPETNQPTATSSSPKPSQPIMASDAAASMFGTPHAEPKQPAVVEGEQNAASLSTTDTTSPPLPNDTASDVFSSPAPNVQPSEAANQFSSPQTESIATEVSAEAKASSDDAGSFFESALPQKVAPSLASTAAPVKSFGGLPPPPVIGGIKPSSTPTSYSAPPVGSSLPPPPMAMSSPSVMKEEEDMSNEMADVSLS
eukprot:scaffold73914_cov61-Cyclotella_meneghiniana.AAC.2